MHKGMTGAQLKKLRATIGQTQEQLGNLLGVRRLTVIRWEAKEGEHIPQRAALAASAIEQAFAPELKI